VLLPRFPKLKDIIAGNYGVCDRLDGYKTSESGSDAGDESFFLFVDNALGHATRNSKNGGVGCEDVRQLSLCAH
jgi:hypothetical protein